MFSKKSKTNYKKIKNMICTFDRSFDNTVVDTYAFDKALHSEFFIRFLYNQLEERTCQSSLIPPEIIQKAGALIIREVETIYAKTKHRVVNQGVYYTYIRQLINRIEAI